MISARNNFPAKIFLILAALLAIWGMTQTVIKLLEIYPHKKPTAFAFAGKKFEGIEKLLKGEKYVGYYTDQNIDDTRPLMEFLQAQQTLVPLILDPENLQHRYIIVNCADVPAAISKFKALGARPVTRNNAGIFIVERPPLTP